MAARAANIPTLVQRLRSPATRARAAEALASLCRGSAIACAAVATAGGVPALVDCLRSGDEAAQRLAVGTLVSLTIRNPALADAIVSAGALPALVACLSSRSPGLQNAAGHALGALAAGHAGRSVACAAAGAIPALASMLERSSAAVHTAALDALCKLSADGGLAVMGAIAQAAPVPTLLRFLQRSCDEPVLIAALGLLGNLARLSDAQRAATSAAVPALLRLLGARRREAVRAYAASALNNLARSPELGRAIVAAGGVPTLVAGMRAGGRSCLPAAGALARLAAAGGGAACQAVAAAGGIDAAVEWMQDPRGSPRHAEFAGALLQILTLASAEQRAAIAAAGGVPALARCLRSSRWPTVKQAMFVLALLERGDSQPPGVVSVTLQRWAQGSLGPEVREAAAAAIHALAAGGLSEGDPTMLAIQAALRQPVAPQAAARAAPAQAAAPPARAAPAVAPAARAAPAATTAAPSAAAAAAAARPPQRPPAPRVCAAPGCPSTHGLRRCGGCGTVRYCSEACSRAHWREHKVACRRLQAEQAAAAGGGGAAAASHGS